MAKVRVPQKDGEIRVSYGGDEAKVYSVSGGTVDVDDADVARFLSIIDDASLVEGGSSQSDAKPAPAGKE